MGGERDTYVGVGHGTSGIIGEPVAAGLQGPWGATRGSSGASKVPGGHGIADLSSMVADACCSFHDT